MSDHEQLSFDTPSEVPVVLGHSRIEYVDTSSILTKATGFMADYDFTLNPYSGCSFGCTYCYAAFFVRDPELEANWGRWVRVKQNALDRLRSTRTDLRGKSIYMSSVTDPYQPIERRLRLVRQLLEQLLPMQPRLVVQTRSPLVVRDIDLFSQLEHARVNMTVTSDDEEIRRVFEPWCPTTDRRLDAIKVVTDSGVATSITLTPLLPISDVAAFAAALRATGVEHFVVQAFHDARGRFIAGTRDEAKVLLRERAWTPARYRDTVDQLRELLPSLTEGKSGFAPA